MSTEQPGLRIGNAERDEAVALLKQQVAEGRLDADELAARTSQVRSARTREDLMPVFTDLPVDVPAADRDAFPLYPGVDPVLGVATTTGAQGLAVPTESTPVPAAADDRIETSTAMKRAGAVLIALMWPAVFVVNMVFGWNLWWLFFIPMFASGWIAYAFGLGGRPGGNRWDDNGRSRRHSH